MALMKKLNGYDIVDNVARNGVITAGTGAAYTATVNGITSLTAGANFTMIPHVVSTSAAPTLNVNGLGAKTIRRRISNSTSSTVAGGSANWLAENKPVKVAYDGTYWIVDFTQPNASDIYGTVPVANGGTGATTLTGTTGLIHNMFDTNLTGANYIPVFTESWADGGYMNKTQLRDAMGAAPLNHTHNRLNKYGDNTITSTASDTTANWGNYANTVHFYTKTGQLIDQPGQWGYLINIGHGSELHQLWTTQPNGDLFHRGGNGSGWNGTWRKILDSSNFSGYALPLWGGTLTGSVTHNAKNNQYACSGGSWINGKTQSNNPIVFPTAVTTDGSRYDPYMWGKNVNGDVWNFGGGASNEIGFWGFKSGRTANGTDWGFRINITNGNVNSTGSITTGGEIYTSYLRTRTNGIQSKNTGIHLFSQDNQYDVMFHGQEIWCWNHQNLPVLVHGGAFINESSEKVKENIQNLDDKYAEKILDIRPITFQYIYDNDHREQTGVIAEEIKDIVPEAFYLSYNKELDKEFLGVDYSKFIPRLIKLAQVERKSQEDIDESIVALYEQQSTQQIETDLALTSMYETMIGGE